MRLLCLHGARSSSDVTRLQLEVLGFIDGAAGAAQLDFIDALFESEEPAAEVERPRSWIDLAAGSDPSQQLEASLRHVIAHVERHGLGAQLPECRGRRGRVLLRERRVELARERRHAW